MLDRTPSPLKKNNAYFLIFKRISPLKKQTCLCQNLRNENKNDHCRGQKFRARVFFKIEKQI